MVDVERIKFGKRHTIDTLISEEALLFAKYLRKEKADYFGLNKFIEWYGKSAEELLQ